MASMGSEAFLKRQLKVVLFLLSFLWVLPGFSDPVALVTKLNGEVLRQQKLHRLSALAVSISFPNYYILDLHAGSTQINGKRAVGESSLFQVGSITKSFTAVTILKLAAQNKIDLDAPLTFYLPQYPKWNQITVRQLLNHTSGIFNYTSLGSFDHIYHSEHNNVHWSPQQIVACAYHRPLSFKPGTSWHYSNTNYILLGMIIHAVTQRPVGENFQTYIFGPYHMNHIYYVTNRYPTWLRKYMVHGYYNNVDKTNINMSWAGSAGALVATSEDLAYWARLLFSGHILPAAQMKEFESVVSHKTGRKLPSDSLEPGYGLGIKKRYDPNFGDIWYHTGTTTGYSGLYIWVPSQNIALSILTSKGDFPYKSRMSIALNLLKIIQNYGKPKNVAWKDRDLFRHFS